MTVILGEMQRVKTLDRSVDAAHRCRNKFGESSQYAIA